MKKLDIVKIAAFSSVFAASVATTPAFANTLVTVSVSEDAAQEIATIQQNMVENDEDIDEKTEEGYLDPMDIQDDMPEAESDAELLKDKEQDAEDTHVDVKIDSDAVLLPEPTRDGYIFIEWNTESDGSGDKYAAGDKYIITGSSELFAIWEAEDGSLTLNLNESSFVSVNSEEELHEKKEKAKSTTVTVSTAANAGANGATGVPGSAATTSESTLNAEKAMNAETGSADNALTGSETTNATEAASETSETGSDNTGNADKADVAREAHNEDTSSAGSNGVTEEVSETDDTAGDNSSDSDSSNGSDDTDDSAGDSSSEGSDSSSDSNDDSSSDSSSEDISSQ